MNELGKLRAKDLQIENAPERTEILAAFRDHDRTAWERFCAARLFRFHLASVVMEAEFEALLARAAATLAEADDEEKVRQAARRAYLSALLIAGYSLDQSQLTADAFLSWWQFNLVGSLGL